MSQLQRFVLMGFLCTGVSAAIARSAEPDPLAARSANTAGLALHKKKQWGDAAEKFKQAIALNPASPVFHYNLACAAARLGDKGTALREITALKNSADPDARLKLAKAQSDPDLASLRSDPTAIETIIRGMGSEEQRSAAAEWVAMLPGFPVMGAGRVLAGAEAELAKKRLLAMPGAHFDDCDRSDVKQGRVMELVIDVDPDAPGEETVLASLADGIGVFDRSGKLLRRGKPFECTLSGASQDELQAIGAGHVTSVRALDVAAIYAQGGRASWARNAELFAAKGSELVSVIHAIPETSDGKGAQGIRIESGPPAPMITTTGKGGTFLKWNAQTMKFEPAVRTRQ